MNLYNDRLFHIYNQGNNRRQIFFDDDDYRRFLWKMKACLLPFGDMIAYCLMPNHFHWLFYASKTSISKEVYYQHFAEIENKRRRSTYGIKYNRYRIEANLQGEITLNKVIGMVLSSYSKAVNSKYDLTGSLFRQHCKAQDGWHHGFQTIDNSTIGKFGLGRDYEYACFTYIHENPVVAGLVSKAIDYEYSSARDYAGLRNGTLCNLDLGRELVKFL